MVKKNSLGAALVVAGTLAAAGCSEPLSAQDEKAEKPPAGVPAPKPDEPVTPLPQRPIDEGAIRALAEEVARLRAELAAQKKAAAAVPFERVPEAPSGAAKSEPALGGDAAVATTAVVEREVPVYVDREVVVEREVPVYVDREVVVEQPTVVLERVYYDTNHCDQWIPWGHVHSIGCGHHYYGCTCHPWYYNLASHSLLSFSYVHVDHDGGHGHHGSHHGNHHGNHHGSHGGGHGDHHDGKDRDRHDGDRGGGRQDGRDRNHDRDVPSVGGANGPSRPDRAAPVIRPGRTQRDRDGVREQREPRQNAPAVVQPGRAPQRDRDRGGTIERRPPQQQRQPGHQIQRERRDVSQARPPQRAPNQARGQHRSPSPPPPPPKQHNKKK